MKNYLLFLAFCCSFLHVRSQTLITLVHSGNSTFFTDLPATLTAAVSGDTILLPGGLFPAFSMNKRLAIIGVGHHPDSTSVTMPTRILGGITFTGSSCDQSFFTGLRLDGGFSNCCANDSITITRCFINGIITGGSGQKWTISECIAHVILDLSMSIVNNNLIAYNCSGMISCQIESNVFFQGTSNVIGGTTSIIKNNIFYYAPIGPVSNSMFFNNITSLGTIPNDYFGNGNTGGNNVNDPNFDGLFQNFNYVIYNDEKTKLYLFDFHLVNPAYNTGSTSGGPIGIYGNPSPWKAGSVPFNPHVNLNMIAPSTNNQGELQVIIRASAQNN